jgi:hypothetical protein
LCVCVVLCVVCGDGSIRALFFLFSSPTHKLIRLTNPQKHNKSSRRHCSIDGAKLTVEGIGEYQPEQHGGERSGVHLVLALLLCMCMCRRLLAALLPCGLYIII